VRHCSTRTLCHDCHREIELHHIQLKKRLREIERKRLGIFDHESAKDSDEDDGILDEVVTLSGRKRMVRKKPAYVKKIIRGWIEKARENLINRAQDEMKRKTNVQDIRGRKAKPKRDRTDWSSSDKSSSKNTSSAE